MYLTSSFRAALLCNVLTVLLLAAAALAKPRDMKPVDMLNIPILAYPKVSPDGQSVLYRRRNTDWGRNRQVADLWVSNITTGRTTKVTSDGYTERYPEWSPDGKYISFVKEGKGDDYRRIYLLPSKGGSQFAVTKDYADVKKFAWTKDSRSIFFLANERLPKAVRRRKSSKDDMFPYEVSLTRRHLWKVDIKTKSITKITDGDYYVMDFSLSPDNTFVAFRRSRGVRIDDKHKADIWIVPASGGKPVRVTNNNFAEKDIQISPDNKKFLFRSDVNERGEPFYDANLFVVYLETGEVKPVGIDQKFEVEEARWSKDGKLIYVQANMGVHSELWELGVSCGYAKQLTDGTERVRYWSYSPAADKHTFVLTTPTNPGDIQMMPGRGGNRTAVTRIFADLGEKYRLPQQKLVRWKAYDGTPLEGLLTLPLNYKPGRRYPLVTNSHGGPHSSDQYGQFRWRTYIPVLAARGYAYFTPNYRGGRGYGDKFMRDMFNGYFNHSHLDVMSGIDYLIEIGVADPNRLAAGGWSAGGHMVNKLMTFTDRFKAISSGAGSVDWVSMYGESDTRYTRSFWFGGSPWQENAPLDLYRKHSPLKDMWKATTPTIIFVGERDKRVPPTQSILLYRALHDFGVTSRLYVAPRESHSFYELRHRLFKINVELEWFEKYVRNRTYEWQEAPN